MNEWIWDKQNDFKYLLLFQMNKSISYFVVSTVGVVTIDKNIFVLFSYSLSSNKPTICPRLSIVHAMVSSPLICLWIRIFIQFQFADNASRLFFCFLFLVTRFLQSNFNCTTEKKKKKHNYANQLAFRMFSFHYLVSCEGHQYSFESGHHEWWSSIHHFLCLTKRKRRQQRNDNKICCALGYTCDLECVNWTTSIKTKTHLSLCESKHSC